MFTNKPWYNTIILIIFSASTFQLIKEQNTSSRKTGNTRFKIDNHVKLFFHCHYDLPTINGVFTLSGGEGGGEFIAEAEAKKSTKIRTKLCIP